MITNSTAFPLEVRFNKFCSLSFRNTNNNSHYHQQADGRIKLGYPCMTRAQVSKYNQKTANNSPFSVRHVDCYGRAKCLPTSGTQKGYVCQQP